MAEKGTLTLWRILKEVSVRQVRRDAQKQFVLGLAGTEEDLRILQAMLLGQPEFTGLPSELEPFIRLHPMPSPEEPEHALKRVDLVLTFRHHMGLLKRLRAPIIPMDEGIAAAGSMIFDARPDLILCIPRRFPALRQAASQELISATSRANAEIAIASALPGVLPVGVPFLPTTSAADIIILTKNQILLLFKIAAVYGKPLKFFDRFRELFPVVGGAFGWRALARELAGAVPAGVGLVVKGTIAYAGTVAVGKGAMAYYEGKFVSRDEVERFFEVATSAGRSFAETLVARREKSLPPRSTTPPGE